MRLLVGGVNFKMSSRLLCLILAFLLLLIWKQSYLWKYWLRNIGFLNLSPDVDKNIQRLLANLTPWNLLTDQGNTLRVARWLMLLSVFVCAFVCLSVHVVKRFGPLTTLWSHGSPQSIVTPSWQGWISPQRHGLLTGTNKIITLHGSPDQQQIVSLSALGLEEEWALLTWPWMDLINDLCKVQDVLTDNLCHAQSW